MSADVIRFPTELCGPGETRETEASVTPIRPPILAGIDAAVELDKAGADAEAIAIYRSILRADPNHFVALVNLGRLYWAHRDIERALLCWMNAKRVKETPDVLYNLGVIAEDMHLFEHAAKQYERALVLDPSRDDARHNLMRLKSSLPPETG